jgi:hypothetical protein
LEEVSPPQKETRRVVSDLSPIGLPFLDALAASPRPADRQLWLRVAADCLVGMPADAPRRRAVLAVTAAALREADEATRSAFARRLTPYPAAADAVAIVEALGGEAALVALAEAVALPRERLIAAAEGEPAQARAVARRADLDATLVARLVEREEIEVVLALARNGRAPIDASRFAALARIAMARIEAAGDRRLADALLERTPATIEQAALFFEADAAHRGRIVAAAQRATLGRREPAFDHGEIVGVVARLEQNAMVGDWTQFDVELAEAFGCAPAFAARIAGDASGEPLAVALAALYAPNDATVRILAARDLLDGGNYRRIAALARLRDALSPAAARLTMAAMIGAPQPAPARRQPQYDPTAAATPSRPAAAARSAVSLPAVLRRRRALALAVGARGGNERP